MLFWRHRLSTASNREDVLDARPAKDEGGVRDALIDRGKSLVQSRGVPDPSRAVPVDELDVELPASRARRRHRRAGIDGGSVPIRHALEPRQRSLETAARLVVALRSQGRGDSAKTRCVGYSCRPASSVATTSAMMRTGLAQLRAELDGALVAVVTVRDQEL